MTRNRLLAAVVALLTTVAAHAEIRLPGLFSDHMVIQANRELRVHGWTQPGDAVTVEMRGARAAATAGADGRFTCTLPAMKADAQPAELIVSNGRGERVTIQDVLVGEVWLGSGQSNMGFTLARSERAAEFIADAEQPQIRLYTVPRKTSTQPIDDDGGRWITCSRAAVPGFSAVLYHFGRKLHDELHEPVGLIHSSWGGTPIQSWTPTSGFTDEEMASETARMRRIYTPKPTTAATTRPAPELAHMMPSRLYNGMIAPLTGYAIRGVVWYQGENNVHQGDGANYFDRFSTMARLWRSAWADPALPFYFAQLAPYGRYQAPAPDALMVFWQQQARIARDLPHTAMAPTADVGDPKDIHPKIKDVVGQRLAALALADTYGRKDVPHAGPTYAGHQTDGAKLRVRFAGANSGLTTRDGRAPDCFEVAGADGRFVSAQATIEGSEVIVWADGVERPVAVRLGWSPTAAPNLRNRDGWPAIQFETGALKQ